jgi:hypothetical protein
MMKIVPAATHRSSERNERRGLKSGSGNNKPFCTAIVCAIIQKKIDSTPMAVSADVRISAWYAKVIPPIRTSVHIRISDEAPPAKARKSPG